MATSGLSKRSVYFFTFLFSGLGFTFFSVLHLPSVVARRPLAPLLGYGIAVMCAGCIISLWMLWLTTNKKNIK